MAAIHTKEGCTPGWMCTALVCVPRLGAGDAAATTEGIAKSSEASAWEHPLHCNSMCWAGKQQGKSPPSNASFAGAVGPVLGVLLHGNRACKSTTGDVVLGVDPFLSFNRSQALRSTGEPEAPRSSSSLYGCLLLCKAAQCEFISSVSVQCCP